MMYSDRETIMSEIGERIADGKTGCIVFDFGACLHYANNIVFKISLGTNELPDQKLNHRYPNEVYRTITRKYGRKVSKIGYPYFFPLKEICDNTWLLKIEFGICKKGEIDTKETTKAVFPIKLSLTEDKPVCGLSLSLLLDENNGFKFRFKSYNYCEETGGWGRVLYKDKDDIQTDDAIPLKTASFDLETRTFVYSTILEPYAQKPDELMI